MRQADDRDDEDNDFDLQGIQDDAIIDYRRLLAIVSQLQGVHHKVSNFELGADILSIDTILPNWMNPPFNC